MKTLIIKAGRRSPSPRDLDRLGTLLREGGIVAFPTETVYGLGIACLRPDAIVRLLILKGSPPDRPLTVHLADPRDLAEHAAPLSIAARRLVSRLWPGPLTLILPNQNGGKTGFRVPANRDARDIIRAAGILVFATSANDAGQSPMVDGADVIRAFEGKIHGILARGKTEYGVPSTVVECGPEGLVFHREGAVAPRRVREAACFTVLFVCTGNLCRSPMAEAILKVMAAGRLGIAESDLVDRGILIHSAGTGAVTGAPATPPARRAASKFDGNLLAHRARPLSMQMLESADLVYVAERRHADIIMEFAPQVARKVFLMRPDGADLPDPFGQHETEYELSAAVLREAMDPILEKLTAESM